MRIKPAVVALCPVDDLLYGYSVPAGKLRDEKGIILQQRIGCYERVCPGIVMKKSRMRDGRDKDGPWLYGKGCNEIDFPLDVGGDLAGEAGHDIHSDVAAIESASQCEGNRPAQLRFRRFRTDVPAMAQLPAFVTEANGAKSAAGHQFRQFWSKPLRMQTVRRMKSRDHAAPRDFHKQRHAMAGRVEQ